MAYDFLYRSPEQDTLLDRLLAAAAEAAPRGGAVALDLDGCLFDNRPRQLRIARTWAAMHDDTRLGDLQVHHYQDWSFSSTMQRMGLPADQAESLAAAYRPFWEQAFFADDFVIHDLPLPGAPRFARALAHAGARVIYLTGRLHAQRPSTLANLRRYGFPIDDAGDALWTKPSSTEADASWKRLGLATLAEQGPLVAFLDNEPIHIVECADAHPEALAVWLDTDHSPRPVRVAEGTPTLRGFLRTSDWIPGD